MIHCLSWLLKVILHKKLCSLSAMSLMYAGLILRLVTYSVGLKHVTSCTVQKLLCYTDSFLTMLSTIRICTVICTSTTHSSATATKMRTTLLPLSIHILMSRATSDITQMHSLQLKNNRWLMIGMPIMQSFHHL